MSPRLLLIWLVAVSLPLPAFGQICRGTADISAVSRVQGGAVLAFPENATGISGVVSGGGDGYFVEGQAGTTLIDSPIDENVFSTTLNAGAQLTDSSRRVAVCPLATFSTEYVEDIFGLSVGGGAAVGAIAVDSDTFQLIPAIGVVVQRSRVRVSGLGSTSDTTAGAELGVGLVFGRRFTVNPSVLIPIKEFLDVEAGNTFRLTFTIGGPQ